LKVQDFFSPLHNLCERASHHPLAPSLRNICLYSVKRKGVLIFQAVVKFN
ncbi:hypothetical protein Anapl_12213, partial [Anas platyrhynchos]